MMYSADATRAVRRGQGRVRPARTAQPRRDRRPAAARRGPARSRRPGLAPGPGARLPRTTAETSPRRCTAAPASASAAPTTPRPAGSCARRTWRPARRRTPPAAAPGCCRRWSTARPSPVAGDPRRCTRRSTCACPARAAPSDCPTGVDMATYKAEVLHQSYRGRLRPASHYTLGRLPRWAALAAPDAARGERRCRHPRGRSGRDVAGRGGRTVAAFRRSPARRSGRGSTAEHRRRSAGDPGAAVRRLVHQLLHAGGRRSRPCGCSRPPVTRRS